MELIYQYLWRYRLFGRRLPLTDGRSVDILHPGRLNRDAGPDFYNARLRTEEADWVGNVEIHEKASDWYRHGHDRDRAYDSVALHVVGLADREVSVPVTPSPPQSRLQGEQSVLRFLPTAEVRIPQGLFITYAELTADRREVRCQSRLRTLTDLQVQDWTESLGIERLQAKAARIEGYLRESNGDWEQATFIALARALGFGLNALPFELLAKSVSLNILRRHADEPMQVEALLFGQAGMLDPTLYPFDTYYRALCREYTFLAKKYSLSPLRASIWKSARTRPGNFPARRVALLACAFQQARGLLTAILHCCNDPWTLAELFAWRLNGYWSTHNGFGSEENIKKSSGLTRKSVSLLLINLVAPLLYCYGLLHNEEELTEAALHLLDRLPAEQNSIVAVWHEAGLECDSAMRSQALIHLRTQYCDAGRCLECRFGYQFIKAGMEPTPRLSVTEPETPHKGVSL